MSFIQIILYRCRFRDFRCSLMVGSVLGRNLKDRPVFGRKKWKNVSVGARWRCYGRGKIAPDFFQGWFCATNALRLSNHLWHASRKSHFFPTPGRPGKSQDRNLWHGSCSSCWHSHLNAGEKKGEKEEWRSSLPASETADTWHQSKVYLLDHWYLTIVINQALLTFGLTDNLFLGGTEWSHFANFSTSPNCTNSTFLKCLNQISAISSQNLLVYQMRDGHFADSEIMSELGAITLQIIM